MEAGQIKINSGIQDGSASLDLERDPVIHEFLLQRSAFLDFLKKKDHYIVCTLGPHGTTSYEAARYFQKYMNTLGSPVTSQIELKSHFDLVYDSLMQGESDLIVIPNAYEKISDMYWNIEVYNIFNYLWKTPAYGIATEPHKKLDPKSGPLRIAICRPVVALVKRLVLEAIGPDVEYELLYTYSTIESAKAVREGRADCAITNEPSTRETSLSFVSTKHVSNVLWSVFSRK